MEKLHTLPLATDTRLKIVDTFRSRKYYIIKEVTKMSIAWTENLATGVATIDDQHKEIFKIVNELLDACSKGKGRGEVGKVIKFLDDYVIKHFEIEESYMDKHAYPDYSKHKSQHMQFKKNLTDLKDEIQSKGIGVDILIETNHLVVDWLVNHISKVDRQLGAFLKTKKL
jgi:hemerythrin